MHYGTPRSIEDVLPYYTHIRRGRPPSAEALQNLQDRYLAIGGPSNLARDSRRQGEAILRGVNELGIEATLYMGAKHTHPFIAEAVRQMAEDGVQEAVGVVLAPHYSAYTIVAYREYAEAERAVVAPSMKLAFIERWGAIPELVVALAQRVSAHMTGWDPAETLVLFSAHSLPARTLASGDPYQQELFETSRLVAEKLGLEHWSFAYQSASSTGEPWLGPDVLDVIAKRAEDGTFRNLLACTVGFVSNHLEVLYDLGIEARERAHELGLEFRLADTIGDDREVMNALSVLVAKEFGRLSA